MLLEETFGFAQSLVCEDHRFRSIDGVADEAAFMKSVKRIPIEAFPGAIMVMQGQVEKREDGIVDGSSVDVHGLHSETLWTRAQNRSRLARISSADLLQTNGRGFAL
ncbi:hypothetical protein RSP799_23565 [Ralstonia solanacearum]|nr:hypothetical protein RSP799_23565 [Ralstonia solanacearum]